MSDRSARKRPSMLLAMAVALAKIAAPGAWANHMLKDHPHDRPHGGNANVDASFDFAASDGSRMFFGSPESLVVATMATLHL